MPNAVKFHPGNVVATSNLIHRLESYFGQDAEFQMLNCLARHLDGDWGNLGDEDKQTNEYALTTEQRILSRYDLADGEISVYVITEWDRSVTTLMLTEDY